jgi:hypothetical protein
MESLLAAGPFLPVVAVRSHGRNAMMSSRRLQFAVTVKRHDEQQQFRLQFDLRSLGCSSICLKHELALRSFGCSSIWSQFESVALLFVAV